MKLKTISRRLAGLALLAGLAVSCTARPSPSPEVPTPTLRSSTLVPFQSQTPTRDFTALAPLAPSLAPSATATLTHTPSPTPRTYVIKAGDDMTGIALRYRVKLDELKTANPSANPRLLKIGSTLVIPGTAPAPAGTATPPKGSPTPSPVPIQLSQPHCLIGPSGGATCFVLATNRLQTAFEGLSVAVRLLDSNKKEIGRLLAVSPLDLLKAGAILPLSAYFPPPLPEKFQVSAELVAVVPATEGEKRYIAVSIENPQIKILPGGLAGEVSGEILSKGDQKAGRVWVAAAAYAASGEVVGVRRWESSENLAAGGRVRFNLQVFSAGGPIDHIELMAEAGP